VAGPVLVALAGTAFLLRARLFLTVRHRVPLVVAGLAMLAPLALLGGPGALVAAGLAVVAVLLAAAGARYAERQPSPYLGRAGDLLDLACVVAVVPLACVVLGLYGLARGLAG
jgi:hypothetical protein